MTFLEKAIGIENGTNVSKRAIVECSCPHDYDMEEIKDCNKVGYENCIDCWNREMSNTELENVKEAFSEIGKAISKASEDVYKEDMHTAYNKGLNDARELIQKIGNLTHDKIMDVYGYCSLRVIFEQNTMQEALEKLKAYEEERKLQVGDEAYYCNEPSYKGVITRIDGTRVYILWCDGIVHSERNYDEIRKTGKHIEISSILEQIGE